MRVRVDAARRERSPFLLIECQVSSSADTAQSADSSSHARDSDAVSVTVIKLASLSGTCITLSIVPHCSLCLASINFISSTAFFVAVTIDSLCCLVLPTLQLCVHFNPWPGRMSVRQTSILSFQRSPLPVSSTSLLPASNHSHRHPLHPPPSHTPLPIPPALPSPHQQPPSRSLPVACMRHVVGYVHSHQWCGILLLEYSSCSLRWRVHSGCGTGTSDGSGTRQRSLVRRTRWTSR